MRCRPAVRRLASALAVSALAACSVRRSFLGGSSAHVQIGSATGSSDSEMIFGSGMRDSNAQLAEMDRCSSLIGAPVKNLRDEKLGVVDEFLVDLASGRAVYAVIAVGGMLGIGAHLVPVPPSALLQHTDRRTLILNESRQELASAPGLSADAAGEKAEKEIYQFHRQSALADRRQTQTAPLEFNYGQNEPTWEGKTLARFENPFIDSTGRTEARLRPWPSQQLIGMPVGTPSDENFGRIQDLVIDLKSGHVAYAVLELKAFSEGNQRLLFIPPMALQMVNETTLMVQMDRSAFLNDRAPNLGDWSDLSDPVWAARLYRWFGQEPYWQDPEEADRTGSVPYKAPP